MGARDHQFTCPRDPPRTAESRLGAQQRNGPGYPGDDCARCLRIIGGDESGFVIQILQGGA